MSSTKIIAAAVMACGIASQAQLLEKYEMPRKETPTAEYSSHDRMSPKVRKFVNEHKSKKTMLKKVVKSDLLGRKGANKSANVKDSVVYMANNAASEKMQVAVVRIPHQSFAGVEGFQDEVRYDENKKKLVYILNGKQMSASEYQKAKAKLDRQYNKAVRKIQAPVVKKLTAEEIEAEYNSSEDVFITTLPKVVADDITYDGEGHLWRTPDEMFNLNGLKTYGHNNGYKGQNVGIRFSDVGCPNQSLLGSNYANQVCNLTNQWHATVVGMVLKSAAPNASLRGRDITNSSGNLLNDFLDSANYSNSNIKVGSNSWHIDQYGDSYDNVYSVWDAYVDQYVYNHRVTEFFSAGNKSSAMPDYYVMSPGRGVNVITVGAAYPGELSALNTYNLADYSLYKNPDLNGHGDGIAKPEVVNFTNFWLKNMGYSGNQQYFSGTSSSTPFTAGMAAALMSQRTEYQNSPEKVKALMLATQGINVQNAEDIDYDDAKFTAHIPSFKLMTSATIGGAFATEYQIFGSNAHNNSAYKSISKTVQQGKRYRVAVAWLESPNYVLNHHGLAHDIDLAVFGTPVGTRGYQSQSSFNNFEVVDFVAKSSGTVDIRIINYRNDLPSDPIRLAWSIVQVD